MGGRGTGGGGGISGQAVVGESRIDGVHYRNGVDYGHENKPFWTGMITGPEMAEVGGALVKGAIPVTASGVDKNAR